MLPTGRVWSWLGRDVIRVVVALPLNLRLSRYLAWWAASSRVFLVVLPR
jgi:hypothetical protein